MAASPGAGVKKKESLKIAVVIERFHPQGGGCERSTAQICRELAQRGHQVTVLAAVSSDEEWEGVKIRSMGKSWRMGAVRLLWFRRWVGRQLAGGEFAVSLSVTSAVPATVVQPRAGIYRELHRRTVARRGSFLKRAGKQALLWMTIKQRVLLEMEKRTLRDPAVKRLVAISRYMAQQIETHYGIKAERITRVPNAAEMPTLTAAERQEARQKLRQAFGLDDATTAFLFPAQDAWRKGLEPLLEALVVLQGWKVPAVLLLAGDDSYPVFAEAAEMGVRDRIRFVGATQHMAELYAAADVTVLPTYYDPASKVVVESLLMGVPAITTAFDGSADWLEVGGDEEEETNNAAAGNSSVTGVLPGAGFAGVSRCGRVVADPSDAQALATAMAELTDPAKRKACTAGMSKLAVHLSMARHVDQLEQVFRQVGEQAK
ncbi:MAG: glycosyltransferase family 4 protein [Phycisphaeraceae bacterium]|nr:glycosyltransferase family 4 protein [Phycisphaeraceae bacterium]